MNKKINLILIFVAIIGGIFHGIMRILNNDVYGFLVCISIMPVMLIPYFLKKIFHIKINLQLQTMYLIFVFFSHFLGSIVNLYDMILGYDKIMHFISGMLTALIGIILLVKMKHYKKKNILFTLIFIIAITLSIASLWEFYEFTFDTIFVKDAQNVLTTGVSDTMWDMILAFFGSIIIAIQYYYEVSKKKELMLTKFINEVGE